MIVVLKSTALCLMLYHNFCNILILLFYFIFYFTCPIMCYVRFALCWMRKIIFAVLLFWRKAQIQDAIFPLFEQLSQTSWHACCPPPPDLKKLVFLRSYDVPAVWSQMAHCVDANLFGQAPSTMSCIENAVSKCRFCSIIFNIFWS